MHVGPQSQSRPNLGMSKYSEKGKKKFNEALFITILLQKLL